MKVGRRPSTQIRKAGAFGLYRGTRQMARARAAARIYRNPFPEFKFVRHKYCSTVTLPFAAAGTVSTYQFRANSMFDPDLTGTGHQPMFTDEMVAQYRYYTVVKSYIKVYIAAENTDQQCISLFYDTDADTPLTVDAATEQHKFANCVKLDKRNGPLVLKGYYNGPQSQKTTYKAFIGDIDQKILTTSNPGTPQARYFTLYRFSPSAAALAALIVRVEMVFHTVWRDPKDHVES